jgi:hypothetical protein
MPQCEKCDRPCDLSENDYGEFICQSCVDNQAESAWERHIESFHDGGLHKVEIPCRTATRGEEIKIMVDPIVPEQRELMNNLAQALDKIFNGDTRPKKVGFALLTYNFGEEVQGTGRINYIGNGKREEVLIALKELIARWEGRYTETKGKQ